MALPQTPIVRGQRKAPTAWGSDDTIRQFEAPARLWINKEVYFVGVATCDHRPILVVS